MTLRFLIGAGLAFLFAWTVLFLWAAEEKDR